MVWFPFSGSLLDNTQHCMETSLVMSISLLSVSKMGVNINAYLTTELEKHRTPQDLIFMVSQVGFVFHERNQVDISQHCSGPPHVRPMPDTLATSGQRLIIKCPVGGYPIDLITWEKGQSLCTAFLCLPFPSCSFIKLKLFMFDLVERN